MCRCASLGCGIDPLSLSLSFRSISLGPYFPLLRTPLHLSSVLVALCILGVCTAPTPSLSFSVVASPPPLHFFRGYLFSSFQHATFPEALARSLSSPHASFFTVHSSRQSCGFVRCVCVCVSWLAEKCHQCCFFCSLALYFSKSLIAWSLIQLKLQHLSLWGVACRSVPFSRYPGTAAPLSLCVCVSSCFTQTLLPSSIVETRRQKGEKKKDG